MICGSKTTDEELHIHSNKLLDYYESCSNCDKYEYSHGNGIYCITIDSEYWIWDLKENKKRKNIREKNILLKLIELKDINKIQK